MTSYATLKRRRAQRKNRPRQPGSTLPRAVAEPKATPTQLLSGSLRKKKEKTKGRSLRSRKVKSKPIRKVNPVAQAKRRGRYRKGLAAYRKSECYKKVEARSGGQCEKRVTYDAPFATLVGTWDGNDGRWLRCIVQRPHRLTHHHKTYARFGGKELPEDIIVLCYRHHEEAESQHPTRQRNYGRKKIA